MDNSTYLEMAQICIQTAVLLTKHDNFYVDDERFLQEIVYPKIIERLDAAAQYLDLIKIE